MLSAKQVKQVEKKHAREAAVKQTAERLEYEARQAEEEKRAREVGLPKALKEIEAEIKRCARRQGRYENSNDRSIEYRIGENHYGEYLGNLVCKELSKLGYDVLWQPEFCEADWSDPDAPGHDSCWVYSIRVSWK